MPLQHQHQQQHQQFHASSEDLCDDHHKPFLPFLTSNRSAAASSRVACGPSSPSGAATSNATDDPDAWLSVRNPQVQVWKDANDAVMATATATATTTATTTTLANHAKDAMDAYPDFSSDESDVSESTSTWDFPLDSQEIDHEQPEIDHARLCQRFWALVPDELDGKYSVSRLDAFRVYRRTSRSVWLTLVVLVTPLPMQLLVNGIFSIPLQDPQRGWQQNVGFFIQVFVYACVAIVAAQMQRSYYMGNHTKLSWQKNLSIAMVMALALTLIVLLLSVLVAFPVPFGMFIPFAVAGPLTFALFQCVLNHKKKKKTMAATKTMDRTNCMDKSCKTTSAVGQTNAQQQPGIDVDQTLQQHMFVKYKQMVMFNIFLLFVYPIYMVGFRRLQGDFRLVYILLLPVLRLALIGFCRQRLDHVEDLAAASTVFSVELMNSMFASFSMGGATSSRYTIGLVMIIDLANTAFCLARLQLRTTSMYRILHETNELDQDISFEDMIEWCLCFAEAHRERIELEKEIRLDASNGLRFSRHPGVVRMLRYMASSRSLIPISHFLHSSECLNDETALTAQEKEELERNEMTLLREVLAFMFMVEYLVLVEYVESVIPVMMVLYYYISYSGPNCAFNLDLMQMDIHQFHSLITNLLLYGALEWLSLMAFFWLIKIRFKVNVFHLLGFVLETHFLDIQGKLGFFLCSTISERFFHYGMDFTFRFEWVRNAAWKLSSAATTGN